MIPIIDDTHGNVLVIDGPQGKLLAPHGEKVSDFLEESLFRFSAILSRVLHFRGQRISDKARVVVSLSNE